jgi:ribonucleoside-diphosphate reductase alpha chain
MLIAKRRYEYREELKSPDITSDRQDYIEKYLNMTVGEEMLEGQYSGAYATFIGSPAWEGKLQYDMWGIQSPETVDGLLDWTELKENIKQYGLRNSLLLAPMPTATTSQILGFNESIEAITSNIFQRQTLAGEFTIINKHLIEDLLKLGLWTPDMKDKILTAGGSIQNINEIPDSIKILYKTVWEIKQRIVIDQSADRGPYVCQSQSLNIYLEDPDFGKLTNVHFYGWKKGLKTGMYYLRSRPRAKMSAYSIEPPKQINEKPSEEEIMACRRDNPEGCLMCSG